MARFRVYYNKSNEFPYVWSFDDGNSKNEQKAIELRGPAFVSAYDKLGNNMSTPKGFFWVLADRVVLVDGIAIFYD